MEHAYRLAHLKMRSDAPERGSLHLPIECLKV